MVSAGMTCVKYLLFLFNLLFAISGIAILTVGAIIQSVYAEYSQFVDGKFFTAPVILIIVGVIIFIVAFFGCCGAVKENRCMIITFAVLLLLIFIFELAGGIAGYVLRNDVKIMVENRLNSTLYEYGKNTEVTKSWDILQHDLKCCGIESYEDWERVMMNKTLPATCCASLDISNAEVCNKNSSYTEGCRPVFQDMLENNAIVVGGVGVGIACIQLIGVIFACCLARSIRKEYETV